MGTKVNTPKYHKFFKEWVTGTQYLPPKEHQHFDLLQMKFYEVNYANIMKAYYGECLPIITFENIFLGQKLFSNFFLRPGEFVIRNYSWYVDTYELIAYPTLRGNYTYLVGYAPSKTCRIPYSPT